MMKMVKNQSKCLVSIRCNSGETRHLAPGHAITVVDADLDNNDMVNKLRLRKVLAISDAEAAEAEKAVKHEAKTSSRASTSKVSSKPKSK